MKTKHEAACDHADKPNMSNNRMFRSCTIEDFEAGVEFAESWIDVNESMPERGVEVFVKVTKLAWVTTDHSVAYLKKNAIERVWIIEGHHCSHYKDAVNNCITHWRPINRS